MKKLLIYILSFLMLISLASALDFSFSVNVTDNNTYVKFDNQIFTISQGYQEFETNKSCNLSYINESYLDTKFLFLEELILETNFSAMEYSIIDNTNTKKEDLKAYIEHTVLPSAEELKVCQESKKNLEIEKNVLNSLLDLSDVKLDSYKNNTGYRLNDLERSNKLLVVLIVVIGCFLLLFLYTVVSGALPFKKG